MLITPGSSVAIVGGSITGPALALMLQRNGFTNVHVYEAAPSGRQQAGGVIGLDHLALDALERAGIPQSEIVSFPSERVVSIKMVDRHEIGRAESYYPGRNTTWPLISGALARRMAPQTYVGSKRVTSIVERDGRAVLSFADGSEVTADVVVFADGRKSTGRKLLDPTRTLKYAGYVAHRGQLEWCPPDVHDFTRLEPWGTQFTMFPTVTDGATGSDWTFYLDADVNAFRDMFNGSPAARTFVLPHQVSPCARTFVDSMADRLLTGEAASMVHATQTRMAAPIMDIDPPERAYWMVGDSPAILLGDALAPVRPHTAMGANAGISEAASLAVALGQSAHHGAHLLAALDGWQARVLPAVAQTIEAGPRLGARLGLGQRRVAVPA